MTLIDPNPTPLARVLGTVVGEGLRDCLRRSGVDYRPGTKVRALVGEAGHVSRAHLQDGRFIEADLVIVALGAIRETAWLAQAGLRRWPRA